MLKHLQTAVVRIGYDLKIFDMLAENETPMTSGKITAQTGADPSFISIFAVSHANTTLN